MKGRQIFTGDTNTIIKNNKGDEIEFTGQNQKEAQQSNILMNAKS